MHPAHAYLIADAAVPGAVRYNDPNPPLHLLLIQYADVVVLPIP